MRNTFRVLFFVNGSKAKNGTAPIMGRITVNGQVAQFSCKLTVPLSLWDAKGNRAKGKGEDARPKDQPRPRQDQGSDHRTLQSDPGT